MAYDLEEQEQLASMKAWWNQYGNLLTWLLIAALAAYAGWSAWNYYQRSQAAQAGQLYASLQSALSAKDAAKIQRASTDMEEKFPRTAYAQMSGMAAAKAAIDAGDTKTARAQLQWVVEHGADEAFRALAKVRLAGVLLDEKAFDEGLKLLSGEFPPAFASVVADRQGDLLAAQNKLPQARAAYQSALAKMEPKNPGRQLIELKLDAIGGAAAEKAPA
jgi:predicted negative regulator of RcsB-dependent stress response